jgi:three-Cys-motif partner protein
MTKNDFWDLSDKPQTKTKLKILKDYLSTWAIIFANQDWCNSFYFIDCFAGRGKYNNDNQENIIDGSPLIALNISRNIKEKYGKEMVCIFVEKDPKVFNELQTFTAPFKSQGINFECIEGDINDKIKDVLDLIPKGFPIFFFMDPGGIDIKRDTMGIMLTKPNIKEFLINYIQKGVERCYAFGKKYEEDLPLDIHKRAVANLQRIQEVFGDDWKCLSENQKDNLRLFLNPVIRYNKIAEIKNRLNAKIIDIYYNRNRNKYYLIFLSRNAAASKIIEDIYIKVKTGGTLLENLPAQEKKKIFQRKFEI